MLFRSKSLEQVDGSLRQISQAFDGFGDYLEKKTIDGKTYLRLPRGATLDGIINKTKLTVEESLRQARSATRIPSGSAASGVRSKKSYDFTVGNQPLEINRGESQSSYLPKLKQAYGDDVIDNAINDIQNELSQTYSGDVTDNDFALLSELYYYLGTRRR